MNNQRCSIYECNFNSTIQFYIIHNKDGSFYPETYCIHHGNEISSLNSFKNRIHVITKEEFEALQVVLQLYNILNGIHYEIRVKMERCENKICVGNDGKSLPYIFSRDREKILIRRCKECLYHFRYSETWKIKEVTEEEFISEKILEEL
jgi:hypothetical protein